MTGQDRKRLTLNGRPITYFEAGPERPSRGVLVLVHAFPLNAEMWRPQLEAPAPGWRLVAPDLRGFTPAGSEQNAENHDPLPSIDDYADDVLGVIEALGIAPAVVCGLSMGGYVLFAMFRRAPEAFRGIVLADTRPQADTPQALDNRRKMLDLIETSEDRGGPQGPPCAGAARVADEMIPKLLSPATRRDRPDVEDTVRRLMTSSRPSAIKDAIYRLMGRPDSTALVAAIRCPTLVLVGEHDTLTPPADSRAMHDRIAGSRLVVIPSAAHLANLEQPERFNAALAAFLDSIP